MNESERSASWNSRFSFVSSSCSGEREPQCFLGPRNNEREPLVLERSCSVLIRVDYFSTGTFVISLGSICKRLRSVSAIPPFLARLFFFWEGSCVNSFSIPKGCNSTCRLFGCMSV